jgi:hypothetical protein
MSGAALQSRQKNVGALFMGDNAVVTEQRGPFFADGLLREITLKGRNRQLHIGSRLITDNLASIPARISTQRFSSLLI